LNDIVNQNPSAELGEYFLWCICAMKVAVLVTLSYNLPIYTEHQRVWREFAYTHPDVDTYFIVSSPHCTQTIQLGDILLTPGEEGYPNRNPSGARLEKTIDAIAYLQPKQYDFIVRTGLSSFWIYANLVMFLSKLPKTHVYCGIEGDGFISGAGMIMSRDVADLLVTHRDVACSFPREEDVRVGSFMQKMGIARMPASRFDITSFEHYQQCSIPRDAYHFRIKFAIDDPVIRKDEVIVMRSLLSKYGLR
jgi:hypothetical protein